MPPPPVVEREPSIRDVERKSPVALLDPAITQRTPREARPAAGDGETAPRTGPALQHAGLTARSFLIGVGLTLLAGLWIRQAEIVVLSTQISESIPAIPGLASLVFLLPINGLFHLLARRVPAVRPLTRAELIVIFLFVTISSTVMGVGVQRFVFSLIGSPFYFPAIAGAKSSMPGWLVPQDTEAMRQLYERSPNGQVPWALWWKPGLVWLGFFAALWCTLYCMMALFYRAWAEDERLSFPLVFLPMEMTGGETGGARAFFRNPLMWVGFSIAAVYNLVNIFHALNPSFPAFGKEIDFSAAFPDAPWNAVTPVSIALRPELVGLGYLVSTELSLTVWLSFVVEKLAAVMGVSMGYPAGQLPYLQEQGMGAYLVIAVFLVWLSRRHLAKAWRMAIAGRQAPGPEGITYRWAFLGLIAGFAGLWYFLKAAGMAGWVAFAYLALVVVVALVYGRLRGEAGVPLVWLFPYYQQKKLLLYTLGSHPFLSSGLTTLPAWALFTFMARGYFPAMTGYQVEGMELARRAGINGKRVALGLLLAVAIGWAVGWYNHLTPYYQHGAQHLRGGIWGQWIAVPEYQQAIQYQTTPALPDAARIWATGAGAIVAAVLSLCRLRFANFPLHPLGFAMTCSYGSLIWGSFFLVWLLKTLALRYGGMAFYRRTIPLFLGLALGHFAVAGILWGLLGAWTGEAVRGYPVFFG